MKFASYLSVPLILSLLAIFPQPMAQAATFDIADGDVLGLIAAINAANLAPDVDTINLAPRGTYTLTGVNNDYYYWGPSGLPVIRSQVTINGNGATIERSNVSGTPEFRIFMIQFGDVTLDEVTIRGGRATEGSPGYEGGGGGIRNDGGRLLLMNCTVTGNSGASNGLRNGGGGVFNYYGGELTVVNSTISHNTGYGARPGGGILNMSTGGNPPTILSRTTIVNSTIFENRADGSGGFSGGGDAIGDNFSPSGSIVVKNSILASPVNGKSNDIYVQPGVGVTSLGHNIVGDTSVALPGSGDLSGDPKLGPLADNGGPTMTHAPLPGSPVLDAVPTAECTDAGGAVIATDQRGVARPQGAACDIGSVERRESVGCQPGWVPTFGWPVENGPHAFAVFDDGTGPALYAGGSFGTAAGGRPPTYVGGVTVNGIAKWNHASASWSPLDIGVFGPSGIGSVNALAVFDDGRGPALYAGGRFTTAGGVTANRIAKWNGSSWSALGSGTDNSVYALAVFDDGSGPALYAGGNFTTAGGVTANRIAKWNGSSWSALGSGTDNSVYALAVFDEDGPGSGRPALYAGGDFTTAGTVAGIVTVNHIAKWDGSTWSALRSGITDGVNPSSVAALKVFDNALYAGGSFTEVDGSIPAWFIAKWNGASWSAVGGGLNGSVQALEVFDNGSTGPRLIAGGSFETTADGRAAKGIAQSDGASWYGLRTGMTGWVGSLATFDDGSGPALFAGGDFYNAGGTGDRNLAKWGCNLCGGAAGNTCTAGQFCKRPEGECAEAAEGVCTDTLSACQLAYIPACGCDGTTYANACMANSAGVTVDHAGVCEGGGTDTDGDGVVDASDNCPTDPNPDQLDTDEDGTGNVCECSGSCDDGNACNGVESCDTATGCVSGVPVLCTASDQCHDVGTCDPSTGLCSNPTAADGTTCTDNNACTIDDTCQAGTCAPATTTVCTASDQCHDVGVCSPGSGLCSNPAKTDGSTCSDGNACTQADTCQAGACTGSNPLVCAAPDQCHTAGTCSPSTGVCSNPAKANGTTCSDGDACTQTDTCQTGACTGSNPVVCAAADQCHTAGTCSPSTGVCSRPAKANGTTCSDGNACTQTDTCQAGACTGSNPVVCAAPDQCHTAGTCSPSTGVCSKPMKANGTTCSDGNACTQTDTCKAGACKGSNPVVCAAPDQCHTAGTCSPSTGICSNPAKANGTTCSDGDACTQSDSCQAGYCKGGPPFSEDFDNIAAPALPTGWTTILLAGQARDAVWTTTTSAADTIPNAATTNAPGHTTSKVLVSPAIPIVTPSTTLTFRNRYNLEASTSPGNGTYYYYDGAVLEIRIGSGPLGSGPFQEDWKDIIVAGGSFVTGGYNGVIAPASFFLKSPIAGRPAWSGDSNGFITTTVNLPASLIGKTIQLRWRVATDENVSSTGQFVDSVRLGCQ